MKTDSFFNLFSKSNSSIYNSINIKNLIILKWIKENYLMKLGANMIKTIMAILTAYHLKGFLMNCVKKKLI